MAPIRLAILEADRPPYPSFVSAGLYGGIFTSLLGAAVSPQPLAELFTITAHNVVEAEAPLEAAYPALDDVDAILVTGSKHSAYQDDPWILALVEYTRRALETGRVRVVGVCFGHQVVGRALGVPVQSSPAGWEVAVYDVDLTEMGKEVFGIDKLRIHQMHRDEVVGLPQGAVLLGSTDKCKGQGMFEPGRYITVQGHPEFTEKMVSEVVDFRYKGGIFDDAMYNEAMDRVAREHDGVAVASAFAKFMLAGVNHDLGPAPVI